MDRKLAPKECDISSELFAMNQAFSKMTLSLQQLAVASLLPFKSKLLRALEIRLKTLYSDRFTVRLESEKDVEFASSLTLTKIQMCGTCTLSVFPLKDWCLKKWKMTVSIDDASNFILRWFPIKVSKRNVLHNQSFPEMEPLVSRIIELNKQYCEYPTMITKDAYTKDELKALGASEISMSDSEFQSYTLEAVGKNGIEIDIKIQWSDEKDNHDPSHRHTVYDADITTEHIAPPLQPFGGWEEWFKFCSKKVKATETQTTKLKQPQCTMCRLK